MSRFHPIVVLPPGTPVLDFTRGLDVPADAWSIGRYDEDRVIYQDRALFGDARSVHVGIDLGAPVGTAVHAHDDGTVLHAGYNPADGDYGHVLVTEHTYEGRPIYVLLGHLSAASLAWSPVGRRFARGDVLGWLGDRSENGGWPPHVHVQLAWERPETHDLPGAVAPSEREAARGRFPDPRLILGPIY